MHSEVSEISPIQVEVKVQVPWERIRKDLDLSFSRVAKTAKIKGFRPGKVPRDVVRKVYGAQVRAEVASNLIEAGLMHAVETHDLHIVAQPEISPPPLFDEVDYEFTAKLEVRPKLESVELGKLVAKVRPSAVEEGAVDAELGRMQKQQADLREPDPMRPAQDGDRLTIAYTVAVDGEDKPELEADEREVDLGDEELLEGFATGLRGMSPGEEKDLEITFPEDHPNPDLKGKNAVFHVKLSAIRELLLPELDDEFAKDLGTFETMDELRADVRKKLEDLATRRREAELKDKLIDALIETNDVMVPPSLVQEEKRQMLYQMMQFAQMMGRQISPSDFDDLDNRATRRVKAGILLGAVARLEKVEVDDAAIDAKLAEMAESSGKNLAKLRVEYQGERRDQLHSQVLEEKLFALLRDRATIEETEEAGEKSE
ncbi:MAG: trigger factor [Sandaracinus sp.]|nr:trigger factor [Sandaracinus sp.]